MCVPQNCLAIRLQHSALATKTSDRPLSPRHILLVGLVNSPPPLQPPPSTGEQVRLIIQKKSSGPVVDLLLFCWVEHISLLFVYNVLPFLPLNLRWFHLTIVFEVAFFVRSLMRKIMDYQELGNRDKEKV